MICACITDVRKARRVFVAAMTMYAVAKCCHCGATAILILLE